ncbi:MAG: replication initiation factor domain-containing protein [Planctomycetes bacterium]|nr:replication initiation factor domain-containing protein [Planctomycetota bacterium]
MGIDKLGLTSFYIPDMEYLKAYWEIREDEVRSRLYKYFCKMDYAEVMWCPHKFGEDTNCRISYSKVDINPKYFDSYKQFYSYLETIFVQNNIISPEYFSVTRVDIKADIENLPIDVVVARLYAKGFNRRSYNFFKGSTIYIGSDPKITIYDKTLEIKSRLKKGFAITEKEKQILEEGKQITRFELRIKNYRGTLKELINDPSTLVKHFERLQFYNFEDEERLFAIGGLQLLFPKINRKFRKDLEKYRAEDLEKMIKEDYTGSVKEWFGGDDIPF